MSHESYKWAIQMSHISESYNNSFIILQYFSYMKTKISDGSKMTEMKVISAIQTNPFPRFTGTGERRKQMFGSNFKKTVQLEVVTLWSVGLDSLVVATIPWRKFWRFATFLPTSPPKEMKTRESLLQGFARFTICTLSRLNLFCTLIFWNKHWKKNLHLVVGTSFENISAGEAIVPLPAG